MYQQYQTGWIEVITGPMFAGKSEELIRRVNTLTYTKKKILAFKPKIDDRYDKSAISSHSGLKYQGYAISDCKEILNYVDESTNVVAIDEVQFFSSEVVKICEDLADKGIRVIVAGLDMDFRGEPFGPMPQLLARAEIVTKLTAVCTICSMAATRTQRLIDGKPASVDDPTILVGAKESYEARCRHHHIVKKKV